MKIDYLRSIKNIKKRLKTWNGRFRGWAKRNEIVIIITILSLVVVCISFLAYLIGSLEFNKDNAISIYGTIIQGMSALLGIAIAVLTFRIQTLENRIQALEQTTLNYISQITELSYPIWERLSYPTWGPEVEEHIESGRIANRYYDILYWGEIEKFGSIPPSRKQWLVDLKDMQQRRLMDSLNRHRNAVPIIRRTRRLFKSSIFSLSAPIITSLITLMMSDTINAFNPSLNFTLIAINVSASALGILQLITLVLVSTAET